LHELGGLLATSGTTWEENPVDETTLADILTFLLLKKITGTTAKTLLTLKFHGSDPRPVPQIISEDKLTLQPMSEDELRDLANEVIRGNERMVRAVREKGEVGKVGWFVGQMVRRGGEGRMEAREAERMVREVLGVGRAWRS
jgi:aspartyl-tRNA(Asn)/glutamyl-tRNA(Gln) amidotransferase subunit B